MVVGPTRLGKTEWARSLGRHMYMCGLFNLSVWDDQADYLVLDDIAFDYIGGSRKSLWGSQREMTLTDKFQRKRSVSWGKPMIYLCNKDSDFRYMLDKNQKFDYLRPCEQEYYMDNCVIVEVDEPLF
jgi:hypothetical protein